jgi:amino acid transporter
MMLISIALLAAFSGFTAICFSMVKHQRDLWKRPLRRQLVLALRIAGTLLLALSWAACAAIWGPGMGTVGWVCCVGLAPIALVFPLAYAPKQCAYAGGLAGALAGCLSLIALVSL